MPTELWNIIWACIGTICTGLITWATTALISLLNTKIKNEKARNYLCTITDVIGSIVMSLQQTIVNDAKKAGTFDEIKKKEVFKTALNSAKNQLSTEVKDFITANYGDLETYLSTQIEAFIGNLK